MNLKIQRRRVQEPLPLVVMPAPRCLHGNLWNECACDLRKHAPAPGLIYVGGEGRLG